MSDIKKGKKCNQKPKLDENEIQYIIQTRREIDIEKQERNKLLYYAITAIGALAIAVTQIDKQLGFFTVSWSLLISVPLLFLITVLISARRMKLTQISDRWKTINDLIKKRSFADDWNPLERIVITGLKRKRYLL
jgi:hypothetical protein